MNIFGIGLPEMAVILVLALLIFGPKKLPEIGSSLGKALRGFQDATKGFENELKREVQQIEEGTATQVNSNNPPEKVAAVPPEDKAPTQSSEG